MVLVSYTQSTVCEFYLNILTYYSYRVSADASELAGYRLNWLDATDKCVDGALINNQGGWEGDTVCHIVCFVLFLCTYCMLLVSKVCVNGGFKFFRLILYIYVSINQLIKY